MMQPMSIASWMSAGISFSIDRQPDTWKPPIATGMPGGAETPRDVHGAGELVRLHADQAEKRAVGALISAITLFERNDHVGLVVRPDT